ncbi:MULTISPECIES: TetR/AcrR family transcriptional regulator [Mumia]|uniref:TetR/AcrR family transcriptional regulator n=1 Tax=Mumia xiangluensis TaxID=1678900 RepID=A0ABW1QRY3_9ACTN|nr:MULTISPECIES: TetR/AcrR family transcriptional regulator [Mumia]
MTGPGRRERNKQEKRERILAAASALFDERGYAAVTTQQVADRADVAAGTLFRYAATKPELLLMVTNARVAAALETGLRRADGEGDPARAALALVAPLLEQSRANAENTACYQREVVYGADGTYRTEALELVDGFVTAIAALLERAWTRSHPRTDAPDPSAAADAVFASLHAAILAAARPDLAADPLSDLLAAQVALIVRGYLTTPRPARKGATT